jgi:uncharacterized membrane protein
MTSSRIKIALAASLALNLFVIGAVAGAAGMQARLSKKAPETSTRGNTSALMRAAEVLPEAKREQYIARLKTEGENAQADFKAARAARVEASALIAAPSYDLPRISSLLAQARTHDVRARTRFETAVIEFAGTLTPAERKVLGERLSPLYRPPTPPKPAGEAQGQAQPPASQGTAQPQSSAPAPAVPAR